MNSRMDDYLENDAATTVEMAERAFADEDLDVDQTALARAQAESEIAGFARVASARGPRDRKALLAAALREGQALGERAYYRIPFKSKNKKTGAFEMRYVEGPTIQLTDALVNLWGDVAIRIAESSVEGDKLRLLVQVVDLRSMVVLERPHFHTLAPAPSAFARNLESRERWAAMQSQAAVSKAIRTTVVHALPEWLLQAALQSARDASQVKVSDDTKRRALEWWKQTHGVTPEQLVELVGEPVERWSGEDLTLLRDLGRALRNGEVTLEESFEVRQPPPEGQAPAQPTGMAALGGVQPAKAPAAKPAGDGEGMEVGKLKNDLQVTLTQLGARAAPALEELGLDPRLPVAKWDQGAQALRIILRALQARLAAPPVAQPAAPQPGVREKLKAEIHEELKRLGKDDSERALVGLGVDLTRAVGTWRHSDESLAAILERLKGWGSPEGERRRKLADELAAILEQIGAEGACYDVLEKSDLPPTPFVEWTPEQLEKGLAALRDLAARRQAAKE